MNKFYANGTPVLNSLAVQTDKPLDAREVVLDLAERDELVSKHLTYDKMRVHVKSNDTIYIYDKDNNKWIEDNYFSEDDKNKLDNIDEYLVNTTILYDLDKTLMIRKHSYNPSTDVTRLFDEKLQEAKVTEDGDLYNGLISKFYINRLNNITNYLIDREFTTKEGDTGLYSTVSRFNTDTKEITKEDLKIPVATDKNDGLLSNIQNIKLNRIEKYVDDIDINHTNVSNIGLQYSYNVYNPNTNENTTYTITIPLSTDSENGLMSNIEHTKLGRIIDYMTEIGIYNQDESGLKYVYTTFNPNTNTESEHDLIIPLSTHDLNGLLSNIDKIKLDDIESFLTNIELIESTDSEDLKLRLHITNPNTQQDTTSEFVLPLVTDTHNGLVSPDIKHWIDQAKGLSNTGTTSDTWQLSKKDIDTKLDPNGGAILKSKDGVFEARNATDTDYTGLTVKDLVIKGNVTQEGDTFITEAETVEISDNTLVINKGETGAGVTKGIAGLIIDRGTSPDYQIIFDEKDDRFKAGEEGDLWCLALRDNDGDLVDGYFTTWDAATKRLKTTNIIPDGKALYFGSNDYYITKYSDSNLNGLSIKLNLTEFNLYTINNYDVYLKNVKSSYSFIIENTLKVKDTLKIYKDNPNSDQYSFINNYSLGNRSTNTLAIQLTNISGSSVTKTISYNNASNSTLGEFTFDSTNSNGFIVKSPRPSQGGNTINHLATEEWVARQKLPVPNSLTWQDSSNVKQSFDGSEEKNLTLWRATHVGERIYEGYVVSWIDDDIIRPENPANNAKWIKIKFPYKYSDNVPFQFTLDGFFSYSYFKIFCSGYLYSNEQNIYYPDIQIINLKNNNSLGLKLNVKLGVDSEGYGVLFILNFTINNNVWGLTIHDFNKVWGTKDWTTGWEVSYSPDPDDTYKWALEKTLYDTVKEDELQTALGKYLPLAGGTMTGAITLSAQSSRGLLTTNGQGLLYYDTTNTYLSDWSKPTIIRSTTTDLIHRVHSTSNNYAEYKIWDERNLPERRTVKTSYPNKVLSSVTSGNWYRICKINSSINGQVGNFKSFLLSINHRTYNNFNPGSHLFSISFGSSSGALSYLPIIKMLSSNIRCFYDKIRMVHDGELYIDVHASVNIAGNNIYASFIGDGVNDIEFILELSPEPAADAKVYEFNISDIEVITNSQLLTESGKYLPLAGGTMIGTIKFGNFQEIIKNNNNYDIIAQANDRNYFGNANEITVIRSSSDIGLIKGSNSSYKLWDSENLPDPVRQNYSIRFDPFDYVGARFFDSSLAKKAAESYIEWWQSDAGWFNFKLGSLETIGSIKANELITASKGIQLGTTSDIGWYNYNGDIAAGLSTAKKVLTGSLLASSSWADRAKVPANGIYSSGNIISNTYFLENRSITMGNYGFGIRYTGTANTDKPYVGLGSEYNTGYLQLYCGMRPKLGAAGYEWANVPDLVKHGSVLSLSESGYLTLKVASWSGTKPADGATATPTSYNVWTERHFPLTKLIQGTGPSGRFLVKADTWYRICVLNSSYRVLLLGVNAYTYASGAPNPLLFSISQSYRSDLQPTVKMLTGNGSNIFNKIRVIQGPGTTYYIDLHARVATTNGYFVSAITDGYHSLQFPYTENPTVESGAYVYEFNLSDVEVVTMAQMRASGGLTKAEADKYYYPLNGKGFLSFDAQGRPVISNNQGYCFKNADGTSVERMFVTPSNVLTLGGTHAAGYIPVQIMGKLLNNNSNEYIYKFYENPIFLSSCGVRAYNSDTMVGGWARNFTVKASNNPDGDIACFGAIGGQNVDPDLIDYAYIGIESKGETIHANTNILRIFKNDITFANKPLAVWGTESNALTKLLYERILTINGTGWSVVGTASGNMSTIYAPTNAGSSGQTLLSTGGIPGWGYPFILSGGYKGDGGVVAPSEVWSGRVYHRMMRGNPSTNTGTYCDWLLMDCYEGSDVPYVTGIGITKSSTPAAYIISAPKGNTNTSSWVRKQLATTDLLDSYLPLSGGKMTGAINATNLDLIKLKYGNSPNAISSSQWIAHDSDTVLSTIGAINSPKRIYLIPDLSGYAYPWDGTKGLSIEASTIKFNGSILAKVSDITWNNLSGKPSSFTPSSHTHTISQISDLHSYWDTYLQASPIITKTSGYPTINNTGNEICIGSSATVLHVNYRTGGGTAPTNWYWRAGSSTSYANGYWGNLYMSGKLVATQEHVTTELGSYLPLSGGTLTGKLIASKGINLNISGISFYIPSFYTWFEYMSQSGAKGACTGGTGSTFGEVTSWARRSTIENNAGYGWIWDSCTNTANANPDPKMALSSSTGNLKVKGSVTASSFIGNIAWSNVTGKPPRFNTSVDTIYDLGDSWDSILKASATSATFTPKAHNQASNTITTMTGYDKGGLTSAISTSDSLNTAIGKLELRIDGKLTTTSTSAGQATQVMVVTQLPTAPQANTLYLIVE